MDRAFRLKSHTVQFDDVCFQRRGGKRCRFWIRTIFLAYLILSCPSHSSFDDKKDSVEIGSASQIHLPNIL